MIVIGDSSGVIVLRSVLIGVAAIAEGFSHLRIEHDGMGVIGDGARAIVIRAGQMDVASINELSRSPPQM